MALLAFVVWGALLGWAASIVEREEQAGAIRLRLLIGALAALIGGVFTSGGGVLGALEWSALGVGTITAVVALTAYWFVFVRRT